MQFIGRSCSYTVERCQTGIAGLDDILDGGIQSNCFYLVQGDPGSGKTALAVQFLLEWLRRGEGGFYITLSETKQELDIVAKSHGWSLDGITLLELSAIEALIRPEAHTTVFHPSGRRRPDNEHIRTKERGAHT